MGYPTEFQGAFSLNRQLTPSHAKEFFDLIDASETKEFFDLIDASETKGLDGQPDGHCGWQPTRTLDGIEWDGEEKFRNYREWLVWLLDNFLKPRRYTLRGSVTWQGEGLDDVGTIIVSGNVMSVSKGDDGGDTVMVKIPSRRIEAAGDRMDMSDFAEKVIELARKWSAS